MLCWSILNRKSCRRFYSSCLLSLSRAWLCRGASSGALPLKSIFGRIRCLGSPIDWKSIRSEREWETDWSVAGKVFNNTFLTFSLTFSSIFIMFLFDIWPYSRAWLTCIRASSVVWFFIYFSSCCHYCQSCKFRISSFRLRSSLRTFSVRDALR